MPHNRPVNMPFWRLILLLLIVLLFILIGQIARVYAQGKKIYVVVKVHDGDTLTVCCFGKKPATVRLIGIDAPEVPNNFNKRTDHFGPESALILRALTLHQAFYLGHEPKSRRDRYGRRLFYLFRVSDGLFINQEMLITGAARFERRFRTRYKTRFSGAEKDARDKQIGLWYPPAPSEIIQPSLERSEELEEPTYQKSF